MVGPTFLKKVGHNLLTAIMRRGHGMTAFRLAPLLPNYLLQACALQDAGAEEDFYKVFCNKLLLEVGRS